MKLSSCNTNRYQTISSCFDTTTAVYSGSGDNYAYIIIQQRTALMWLTLLQ